MWQPVPVPPPAYTLKPPAPSRAAPARSDRPQAAAPAPATPTPSVAACAAEPKTIDLTQLGLWTDERDVRESLFHADEDGFGDGEPEIDDLLERHRAVGG